MTTPHTRLCSQCGRPLAPDGDCPVCALKRALALSAPAPEAQVIEQAGNRIGPYKLLEKIGEGGYGSVYMAEQAEPIRRRVALKIVKLGMDTKQVIARFEAERQALALMDHPNIARIFDAGITGAPSSQLSTGDSQLHYGRPYFVMELVRGVKITDYCDRNNLSTRERLNLFMQVCHAVQHAHQKGIIHRDLKPSNILVTQLDGKPVPKVIDFGIAKATGHQLLTDKTLFTAFQQFIGTPAYMSPEQAEVSGADIDTRSDIYALGVLLYELLTGHVPFEKKDLLEAGFDEMRRIIREKEPPKPSTRLATALTATPHSALRTPQLKEVRGDLDWIVMKCLEKERARRYDTASSLAHDIQRHLSDEPVTARPPGATYRLRKMVRRNKLAFAAATAVMTVLALGIVGSTWQAVRATRAEREKARLYQQAIAAEGTATAAKQDAIRQKEAAEHQAYVANIAAAGTALAVGDIKATEDYLSACPKRMRNWEWRHLNANRDQSIQMSNSSANGICAAAYSTDGSHILAGGVDGSTWILDAVGGEALLELHGHTDRVGSVAYSPDGKRIATASGDKGMQAGDKTARIWNASTGTQLSVLQHQAPVNSVGWNPEGTRVVTAAGAWGTEDDNSARVWDAETGHELLCLSAGNGAVIAAAFSPDGKRIVTGEWANTGRVWDATTGKQVLVLDGGPARAFFSVAFSHDGTKIISSSSSSCSVNVWDAATGRKLLAFQGHRGSVHSAVFSHDGLRIASGGGTLRLWEAATGRPLHLFVGEMGHINTIAFSPDDSRILTASRDGGLRIWQSDTDWTFPVLRGHKGSVCSAVFSPDDSRILTACSGWGNRTDHSARIWDATTGKVISVLRGHAASVNSAQYSHDGMRIVTASDDETARVWDAITGMELLVLRGHTKDVSHAVFSPDGRRIVTTSGGFYSGPPNADGSDHTIRVWDAATGSELFALSSPDTDIHCAAFSPDGTRIVTTTGIWKRVNTSSAQVRDASTGEQLTTLQGHSDKVFSAAWNADGSRIVTASWDFTARVWNPVNGEELLKLQCYTAWVHSAAFSPDGSRIVTACNDQTVRVWDAATGMQLLVLREHINEVYSARFSHDGTRIVTCSNDGTARVWDSLSRQERYSALLAK